MAPAPVIATIRSGTPPAWRGRRPYSLPDDSGWPAGMAGRAPCMATAETGRLPAMSLVGMDPEKPSGTAQGVASGGRIL